MATRRPTTRSTIIIMVDEPSIGSAYGSIVAAPYIGNVLREILPYLGVEAVYSERELAICRFRS